MAKPADIKDDSELISPNKASSRFDLSNKGYLDKEELRLQQYDTNNNGQLGLVEMKNIMSDLLKGEKKEQRWRRYTRYIGIFLVLSVLSNFAMVWTALILTHQVEVPSGRLVGGNGRMVAHVNQEFFRRSLEFQQRHLDTTETEEEMDKEFRELAELVPIATTTVEQVQSFYENDVNGVYNEVTIVVEYTGVIAPGMTHTASNENGCEQYDNIYEVGTESPVYRVECCGEPTCDIYDLTAHGRRLCFSPMTVVDVLNKGPTHLKDVHVGDKVLGQGGEYQLFYTVSHQSKTEPSEFRQLFTKHGKAPLELSDAHMVYLHGKPEPVPASFVKVGDKLVGGGPAAEPLEVIKIDHVIRKGFIHGLTADGTIVANGILASTHAAHFGESSEYLIDNLFGFQFIHAVTFENFIERPMRRLCMEVSLDLCNKIKFHDEGTDVVRNLFDGIGRVWRQDICETFHLGDIISLVGSIIFLLSCNLLASPLLLISFVLAFALKKKMDRISFRVHQKKVKSV